MWRQQQPIICMWYYMILHVCMYKTNICKFRTRYVTFRKYRGIPILQTAPPRLRRDNLDLWHRHRYVCTSSMYVHTYDMYVCKLCKSSLGSFVKVRFDAQGSKQAHMELYIQQYVCKTSIYMICRRGFTTTAVTVCTIILILWYSSKFMRSFYSRPDCCVQYGTLSVRNSAHTHIQYVHCCTRKLIGGNTFFDGFFCFFPSKTSVSTIDMIWTLPSLFERGSTCTQNIEANIKRAWYVCTWCIYQVHIIP